MTFATISALFGQATCCRERSLLTNNGQRSSGRLKSYAAIDPYVWSGRASQVDFVELYGFRVISSERRIWATSGILGPPVESGVLSNEGAVEV